MLKIYEVQGAVSKLEGNAPSLPYRVSLRGNDGDI